MRIGEIAEKTGLSISNIRFYERKGLIGPDRDSDSKYRNYSQEDLERLQEIILYRKMDIPVETIGLILEKKTTLKEVLAEHVEALQEKQRMLQNSTDLCIKILEDNHEELDLAYYLNYVHEEEEKGNVFEKFDDIMEDFATFTKFDRFVGGSYLGWFIFGSRKVTRIVTLLWCAFFALVPVWGIIDEIMDEGEVSPVIICFWVLWMLCLIVSFIKYRKARKI